jgi:hypothetical protein
MTELKVAGLVDIPYEEAGNTENQIVLKPKFDWFLSQEFADHKDNQWMRKEKAPPTRP